MGPSRALRSWLVALASLASACAPEWGDEVTVVADAGVEPDAVAAVDAPAPALDRPVAPRDAPAFDAPVPLDIPRPDVPTVIDVPTVVDVPTVIDVPTVVDVGPPDTGCHLPPPAARPPAPGPDGSGVIRTLAAEHPDWLRDSCISMGGTHRFLFEALRRGRAIDPRWGLDRRTGPLSGDILTYFYGDGCPEGRRETYMFDVITRHCARPGVDEPAAPGWIDRSSEGAVWTLMGYDSTPPPDAGTAPPVDVPPTHTRPTLPDGRGTLQDVAREHPDGLHNSCVADGGNNDFLFEVVRRLRRIDRRWGLNWKRGRVGDMSQDVVNYFYGPSGAAMEGSLDTYVVDVISGHCGPTPGTTWIDQTGVGGAEARWTLAGRSDL
jgi:hypothetical protein